MLERSTGLAQKTGWLVAGMAGMLAAAIIALLLHAVAVFAIFMILMVMCGIAAIIVAVAAYNTSKREQAELMREEMGYRQRRSGGSNS